MMATQSRRQFLRAATILGGGGALALVGHAQDTGSATLTSDLVTSDAQAVIDKGLNFLAVNQSADGSFADSQSGLGNVAITGLAGLALMAGGHQPGRGRYGYVVSRATDYIVSRGSMNPDFPGYLNNTNTALSTGSMYQHGFGALFLAEVYGMLPDADKQKRLRSMLEKAIGLTRNAQNREGGWRYTPTPNQADVSVTVAQLMALRAAKNAGVTVPKSVIDNCVTYIKACQLLDGGFCYVKGQRAVGSAFPRSAAAVVGLFSAGIYEGREIEDGLRYLLRFTPGRRAPFNEGRGPDHYHYAHYYAALAMWTAGGNYWSEWFPAIRDELIVKARQGSGNNGWNGNDHGQAYSTAMTCIILQLPNNYLPIMQK